MRGPLLGADSVQCLKQKDMELINGGLIGKIKRIITEEKLNKIKVK